MDKVVIGGYEFDRECPKGCPGRDEYFGQGGLCHRCPIFNCLPSPGDDDGFVLLRPDEYRSDWAKAWRKWFDGGMEGLPSLLL